MKWFDDEKGFGFITPDGGGDRDLFVHHSSIVGQEGRRSLGAGDRVSFEATAGDKGPKAEQVVVA